MAFRKPLFDLASVHDARPPAAYPPIESESGSVDPVATGIVGAVVGAAAGATYMAAKRFSTKEGDESVPRQPDDDAAPDEGDSEPRS